MLNSSMDVPFPFKENQSAIDQCIAYLVWANVSLAFALIKSSILHFVLLDGIMDIKDNNSSFISLGTLNVSENPSDSSLP